MVDYFPAESNQPRRPMSCQSGLLLRPWWAPFRQYQSYCQSPWRP
jgi:hypothetical protein